MVYGTDVVLPINLALPVMKLWQDEKEESNLLTRRINQLIEVQQHMDVIDEKLQKYQDNMKLLFDRKAKNINFLPGDLVLRWDARKEDSGKTVNLITSGMDLLKYHLLKVKTLFYWKI
jgi:hypothetical protein